MAYEEKIKSFREWAVGLGCPLSALPTEDALRSVFKSGNCDLFMQLQQRIHPRQYVQEVRETLLMAKLAEYEGKVIPICERSFLPREMQMQLKMQDLDKKKEEELQKLAEVKKQYDENAAYIKSKTIQLIAAKHKHEMQKSRVNILKLKLESLDKAYEEEMEIQAKILATMPVKLNSENASEKLATQAVKEALKELENFYAIYNAEGNNSHTLNEAKNRLWDKMRQIFKNTPNVLIFNAIMKLKDEQLQEIIQLNKLNAGNTTVHKPVLDNYSVKLLKTKADLMGIVAKYVNAKNEVSQLEELYAQKYSTFVDELQQKVNNFNDISSAEDAENSEEIISDYVLQYNMHNFYKARNEYISEQIDKLQLELETGAKQLENHEMLIVSLKQLYNEMNSNVNRIQHDVVQMSQIKDKILYSKNLLKNLLDEMNQQTKSQMLSTKLKGNISLLGMDSFSLANESVFSSTKLDIDANATVMNSTMRRSFDNNTLVPVAAATNTTILPFGSAALPSLPCHLLELNTFAEIPMEKFSCTPRACLNLLSANPLLLDSQELSSTLQLVPGHLLTPLGVQQEVSRRILWASTIDANSTDLKLNFEPLIVDPHDLKMKARRQMDEIVQYEENIKSLGVRTQHQIERAKRIYQFILDNPLAKFVPPSRTFNNATFAEYEAEFNLYYRIATANSNSTSNSN